jgi:hypothetical protein
MVLVTLDEKQQILFMDATVVVYGHASNPEIRDRIADEIQALWNEPQAVQLIRRVPFTVMFRIRGEWMPHISPDKVLANTDPQMNYYRVEQFALGNISFVDGLGSNTGYFKLENLYEGSTTAAHEFGHGLGLDHPRELDIRGLGRPGIMYPRGTWVDPPYQYDSTAQPGAPGGTMHPMHRRVLPVDIHNLRLDRLRFINQRAVLGGFTNIYHQDHGG